MDGYDTEICLRPAATPAHRTGTLLPSRHTETASLATADDCQATAVRFSSRVGAPVRDLAVVGGRIRCLLTTRTGSTIVDLDPVTGETIRCVEGFPRFTELWAARTWHGLAITRTAAVGRGPTHLTFLDPDQRVVSTVTLPDATSTIADDADGWYVGCRDGSLVAMSWEGCRQWSWQTPGSERPDVDRYQRACPYFIVRHPRGAVVASFGHLYAVGPTGTQWHPEIPHALPSTWLGATDAEQRGAAAQTLGISAEADVVTVKSAYRRGARATHPDLHPGDSDAAAAFTRVQDAYARLREARSSRWETAFTVSFGFEPCVSTLAAGEGGFVVGSSDGRLYRIALSGRLDEWAVLGSGTVCGARRADGTIGAVLCDGELSFIHGDDVVHAASIVRHPSGLSMCGPKVGLRYRHALHGVDATGDVDQIAALSTRPTRVVAYDDGLVWANGRVVSGYGTAAPFGRPGIRVAV